MPQSLIQLPKEADFKIDGRDIEIWDHKFGNDGGLIWHIICIIHSPFSNRETLTELEKHGISFEAVIEYCVTELERDIDIRTHIINWYHNIRNYLECNTTDEWIAIYNFSKSMTGKKIADKLVEKIRSCDNWEELYDELHRDSRFQKDLKKRIIGKMEQKFRQDLFGLEGIKCFRSKAPRGYEAEIQTDTVKRLPNHGGA